MKTLLLFALIILSSTGGFLYGREYQERNDLAALSDNLFWMQWSCNMGAAVSAGTDSKYYEGQCMIESLEEKSAETLLAKRKTAGRLGQTAVLLDGGHRHRMPYS